MQPKMLGHFGAAFFLIHGMFYRYSRCFKRNAPMVPDTQSFKIIL